METKITVVAPLKKGIIIRDEESRSMINQFLIAATGVETARYARPIESIGERASADEHLNLSGKKVWQSSRGIIFNASVRAILSKRLVDNCRFVENCELISLLSKTTLAVLLMERDV